jgi:hypothetical protein
VKEYSRKCSGTTNATIEKVTNYVGENVYEKDTWKAEETERKMTEIPCEVKRKGVFYVMIDGPGDEETHERGKERDNDDDDKHQGMKTQSRRPLSRLSGTRTLRGFSAEFPSGSFGRLGALPRLRRFLRRRTGPILFFVFPPCIKGAPIFFVPPAFIKRPLK